MTFKFVAAFSAVVKSQPYTSGVPNSWFEKSIKYAYRMRHGCLKCTVLCYTFHDMEFKIMINIISRWNKMLPFGNKIKKIHSPCLVSVVHLVYSSFLVGSQSKISVTNTCITTRLVSHSCHARVVSCHARESVVYVVGGKFFHAAQKWRQMD